MRIRGWPCIHRELPASASEELRLKLYAPLLAFHCGDGVRTRAWIIAVKCSGEGVGRSQGGGGVWSSSPLSPSHTLFVPSSTTLAKHSPGSLLLALRTPLSEPLVCRYLGQTGRLTEPVLSCVCLCSVTISRFPSYHVACSGCPFQTTSNSALCVCECELVGARSLGFLGSYSVPW